MPGRGVLLPVDGDLCGGPRGCLHRSKVSMTIMRPPAPEVVARTIVEAGTAFVPKRRYAAGKMARRVSLLRRFVPESAFDKSLRKQYGLPI